MVRRARIRSISFIFVLMIAATAEAEQHFTIEQILPHDLIVFPDEVHEYLVFDHWRTAFNAADDFFKRYLRVHTSNQN